MAFYGIEFIYDGIPSSTFGLFISKMDGQGVLDNTIGSSVKPITKKLFRNPVEFLYGTEQSPVLEFDLEFFCAQPLSADDRNIVATWLFGQQKRKKLQILQGDLSDTYFNCIMDTADVSYVGNISRGFKAHVVCDSPWGWGNQESFEYNTDGNLQIILMQNIFNVSADNYYTYPTIEFTMGSAGTTFTVNNLTDEALIGESRPFTFSNLTAAGFGGTPPGETVTVDNRRQIITSSKGLRRLGNFNLKWMRLLQGENELQITGSFTHFNITYDVAKKVGG